MHQMNELIMRPSQGKFALHSKIEYRFHFDQRKTYFIIFSPPSNNNMPGLVNHGEGCFSHQWEKELIIAVYFKTMGEASP